MANPFASKRLLYRAIDPDEDQDWTHRNLRDVPILMANTDWRLLVPQSRKETKEHLKSVANEHNVLGLMICLRYSEASTSSATNSDSGTHSQENQTTKAKDTRNESTTKPTPIGILMLNRAPTNHPHNRGGDIAITLATPYHGQGYGSEAINWCLDWAFTTAGYHRVGIGAFTYNDGAVRLYKRLGFTEEGRWRECVWYQGRWEGVVLFGMLEGEWRDLVKGRRDES